MAKAYTNVNSTTGTFAGWLSKSNELFYDMSTMIVTVADVSAPNSSNEARTTGNADIQGYFSANNIVVWDTLAGGRNEEWANTDTLYIVSNTQIGNSSQTDTLTVYGDATFDANVQIGSAATDGLTIAANTVVNGLSFFTANTRFNDNARISFGTDSDTSLYHDGSDLILTHNNANTSDFIIEDVSGNDVFTFTTDTSVFTVARYDDDTDGPQITLKDVAPSANGQYTGRIAFQAADSGGNNTQYARIMGIIEDSIDGTEDGSLYLQTIVAGTNRSLITVNDNSTGEIRLYHANSSSSAVKLTTKTGGVLITGELQSDSLDVDGVADISGVVTLGANANFGDADQANFGAAADLQIFHDASHSHINDTGTGNLKITSSQIDLIGPAAFTSTVGITGIVTLSANVDFGDADQANFGAAADLQIYHDASHSHINDTGTGNLKITSSQIDLIGPVSTNSVFSPGANTDFTDNIQANFGAAADLQIFHDATDSHIKDNGTGNLKISSSQIDFLGGADGAETMATMVDDGAVTLYHNNSAKIATSATGVAVTGTVAADGLDLNSDFTVDADGNIVAVAATFSGLTSADGGIDVNTAKFTVAAAGDTVIAATTASTSSTTGALKVAGGTGIAGKLFVGDDVDITGDLVVDGTASFAGSGNLTVNNSVITTLSVTGDTDIGTGTSDTLTINASVDSNIVPSTDSARDLGTTSLRWRNAFIDDLTLTANVNLQTRGSALFYDADNSNYVAFKSPATVASNITWTLPDADATTSGQALVSNALGVLSWAAAGATTTSDTSTNAEEQIYFGDITSGAVTAVHHDAGLTYNPSTGTLTSDAFAGVASSATTLTSLTSTVTELNKVDGDTAASSITAAGADRVVYNDAGVMKQVALTTLDTYFSGTTKTLTNKTLTSPTLNTPSIGTSFTFDSITVDGIQTSGESFADNNTSLMTSAAINDKIQAVIDADNTVIQVDSAATKTSGDLTFNDSVAMNFGTDTDAEIYHTGSHLYADINTGSFFIRDGADSNATIFSFTPSTSAFSITNADAAAAGPTITLRHDSASPAASDELGQIFFQMDNAAGVNHNYAYIDARVVDPTTDGEDGSISLYTVAAGTSRETIKADSGVATLYHNGSAKLATASGGVTITGTATAATFSGSGASLTALPAASLTGTIADARLPASISSDITGNAATATKLATTRAIEVSGAVTGTANFDGSGAINIVTTATADPTITLGGDLTGSATLTNLGNATLTATIAATSVETSMIAADAITGAKIADDAIDSEHYTDGSIDTAHIAADAITGAKIADDAIDSEHYVDASIDTVHIRNDAVTNAKIGNLAVGADQLASNAVTNAKIGSDAVTGAKIADDAIDSEHYAAGSVDAEHLNVTGNGTTSQFLRSDGDGSFTWAVPAGVTAVTINNTTTSGDIGPVLDVALSGSISGSTLTLTLTKTLSVDDPGGGE